MDILVVPSWSAQSDKESLVGFVVPCIRNMLPGGEGFDIEWSRERKLQYEEMNYKIIRAHDNYKGTYTSDRTSGM